MKKLIMLLGGVMLLSFSASAQTEKGTVLLGLSGGNLSYARNSNNKTSSFSAAVYPTAGLFLANNFLVGTRLNLGYSHYKTTQTPYTQKSSSVGYGLGTFARYYVPSSSKHRFFAEAGVDYSRFNSRSKTEQEGLPDQEFTQKRKGFAFHGALGYNYFFTPNVALEATAGYYHSDPGRAYSQGRLGAQLGLSIFLQKRQPAATQP